MRLAKLSKLEILAKWQTQWQALTFHSYNPL